MGLWLLLGSVDATGPAQAWLAPYSSARHLLSGHMSHVAWAQWLLVLLIWGVALNCVGILLLKHGRPKSDSRS